MRFKAPITIGRQRREFIYSLAVIVLIPLALIANTVWFDQALQHNLDEELRHKANLANEIVAASVASAAGQSDKQSQASLQAMVDRIKLNAEEVSSLSVLVADGTGYKVSASSDHALISSSSDNAQLTLARQQNQPVAALIEPATGNGRVWRVVTPVSSTSPQPILASIDVSLKAADTLLATTLRTSLIILIITIGIVMLLLINHFRFVQYAELFRKQKELDQMKNDFISIATHELKAPMSIIKGYISNVLDGTSGKIDGGAKADLVVAFDQTDRLTRLVADLLDVSRIEQNRTSYSLQPVKLSEIITPMVKVYQPKAAAKGIDISYNAPKSEPIVLADPDRVSEIFTNLIDNAVKYSLRGSVVISQRQEGNNFRTSVKDTGIGIAPAERARLFERFYRVKNEQTKNISGTGLGLWIIKQYTERMGGQIHVDSTLGIGSEFIVLLPLAPKK